MSVLISVPIGMAISQYSNLNHASAQATFDFDEYAIRTVTRFYTDL